MRLTCRAICHDASNQIDRHLEERHPHRLSNFRQGFRVMQSERCVGMKSGLRTALARNPGLFPLTMWVLLYAWRPLRFGFYHDDWSLLLGCNGSILQEIYCVDTSRPGAPLVRWIIHGLIGANPAAWQLATTVSMLGAALILMTLLNRLARADGLPKPRSAWAAAITATSYLAFPWMLGIAWVTATSPNIATIFFTLAMYVWFAPWRLAARCLASAILFCFSSLIYEAYWFAFLPFAALLWLREALPRRDLMVLALSLSGMQLILIGFNRIVAALGIGANKSFNPNWLHTLSGAWPPIVGGGVRDIYGVHGRCFFLALIVSILIGLWTRHDVR
jgi:hypothetical protein